MVFKCEGVSNVEDMTLSFDRRDPITRSSWSGTVRALVKESECTQYGVDARGNRICVASRIMSVERTGTVGGTILLKQVSAGAQASPPASARSGAVRRED